MSLAQHSFSNLSIFFFFVLPRNPRIIIIKKTFLLFRLLGTKDDQRLSCNFSLDCPQRAVWPVGKSRLSVWVLLRWKVWHVGIYPYPCCQCKQSPVPFLKISWINIFESPVINRPWNMLDGFWSLLNTFYAWAFKVLYWSTSNIPRNFRSNHYSNHFYKNSSY